ncbi:PL29 family lyase N-terminal domain-containing protein [Phocaeicola plebeius]|uniref:PL29 family lyase N-terminal domain-containing protein n=1 Tax=Phocaeicola plebeius TaxID=310297 RepID=UPI0026EFA61E|nr:PL29 family lyase N-terminal domain-containing protein [Phocaeicola plebeius]
MKIYKYIGVALMVLSLGACKTDDLERDIDALKDRVTAMEAKVDRLNESMNMIRVALDGNKTIQCYTENEDGSYTLTLSDGNTITLTQGEIGATDVYQEVSISTDGNWVIGGVETEHRALAVGGEPGVTPQFRLTMESEGKYYWEVSYDGELTWEEVKSQQGTRVYASASGSSSVAGPIASAAPNATGDKFEIILTGSGTKYEIPIVSGLACAITEPALEDGFWIVPTNTGATTPIDLKGEAVLISAPEGWTVTASIDNSNPTTLSVTPPNQDGAEGIITLQVNKGVYWAIDQIKVRSKKVITSWKAEYEQGGFYIGNELVNSETYPTLANEGNLIEDGGTISNSGVHFIKGGVNISISSILAITGEHPLVIVGDDPNNPPTVTFTGSGYLRVGTQNLLCKNVKFVRNGAYLFHVHTSANVDKVIFDQCEMELSNSFAFSSVSSNEKIDDFQFSNNKVKFTGKTETLASGMNFVNFGTSMTITKANISNNIFYSKSNSTSARGQFFTVKETAIKLENNTFCNYIQNPQGIKAKLTGDWSVRYNIFYSNISVASNNTSYLIWALEGSTFPASNDAFESNVAYNAVEENATDWTTFASSSMKPSGEYSSKIPQEEQSPLQIVDWEKGEFVSLKAGYGAAIE